MYMDRGVFGWWLVNYYLAEAQQIAPLENLSVWDSVIRICDVLAHEIIPPFWRPFVSDVPLAALGLAFAIGP